MRSHLGLKNEAHQKVLKTQFQLFCLELATKASQGDTKCVVVIKLYFDLIFTVKKKQPVNNQIFNNKFHETICF